MLRSNVFVLHLIADNTDRPVYLSATDGRYGEQLGLQDHSPTQGLARKVVDAAPVATPDTVRVPGDGWLDTSRSLSLWNSFSARETFAKHHGWTDQASLNMPLLYVLRGYYLSEGLALRAGPGRRGALADGDAAVRIDRGRHRLRPARPPARQPISRAAPA